MNIGKTKNDMTQTNSSLNTSDTFLFKMQCAPKLGSPTNWFQMVPIAFFSAIIIIITRMYIYERPMNQFYWSGNSNQLTDFFSYYKMAAILLCGTLVIIVLLYRVFCQSLYLQKSYVYVPMIVYICFVLLSYLLSDYKYFALWGWNDRFEGTLSLIGYMVMLFYIINTIRSERDVKWVIYTIAFSSTLLGFLGLSQALDHDFFRTTLGKKLITPGWFWDNIDGLNFTFQNKEIYQTVYNINYVSFYLTLLIPLFGMLFIKSLAKGQNEPKWIALLWGAVFSLLIFNLIGSASSGGLMGMAVVVIIGLLVLNKNIIRWNKPILILVILTVIISGLSYQRWMPELADAIRGVLGTAATDVAVSDNDTPDLYKIDYFITTDDSIIVSVDGRELTFKTFFDDPKAIQITDSNGNSLDIVATNVSPIYRINDPRFDRITLRPAEDDKSNNYFIIGTNGNEWPFQITKEGPKYLNGMGSLIDLKKVPAVGWENNQSFGSGRGYIWSRTIPMLKDTLFVGRGADTYCAYFPQYDYAGKYNSGAFSTNINIVIDKPHNMYLGAMVGTGAISLLALITLWGIYIVQSFKLYRRIRFDNFISFAGVGIFLGICGFLVSGLVNDSTVSVMPMFYGLLGTGISINTMLKSN